MGYEKLHWEEADGAQECVGGGASDSTQHTLQACSVTESPDNKGG